MAFTEDVYKVRRIVLVRFSRARRGGPRYQYPDLDNRGWLHDPPGANGETPAEVHGPVLGMQQDKEVFIDCERTRLEPVASGGPELYLKSEETSVVAIADPAPGQPLSATGRFKLKGATGSWRDKFARVTVRINSDTGPIIGEMGVRVFQRRTVQVQPWLITIRGRNVPGGPLINGAPATNAARVTRLMNVAKRVWRQCGIWYNVHPTLANSVTLNVPGQISENSAAAPIIAPNGTAFPASSDDSNRVHRTHRRVGRMNVWWIQQIVDLNPAAGGITNAWAMDNSADAGAVNQSGIVMTDGADGNDLAHEIGHYLTLDHADEPAAGSSNRDRTDIQVLRRLMHRYNPHGVGGFRANVGYGRGLRGALLTMRDKPKYFRDDEWFEARRHAINGPY